MHKLEAKIKERRKGVSGQIKKLDFCFENSLFRIVADSDHPKINLAGLSVGPFQEGNEYEVRYWIAKELVKSGIAHFLEDDYLDATKLYKIQWKERVQIAGQISELSEDFYPRLRRYLKQLKAETIKSPEMVREYEKAKHLAWDIVNSRLKKIVALSSGLAQTSQTQRKITCEERVIYNQLYKIIKEWKERIIDLEGGA